MHVCICVYVYVNVHMCVCVCMHARLCTRELASFATLAVRCRALETEC